MREDFEYEYSYLLVRNKTSNPLLKTKRPEYWNPNNVFRCVQWILAKA